MKPDVAIFLFSKEMAKKERIFFKTLDDAIKEIQKKDKSYSCDIIKPDDNEHKDLIETEELSVNYNECFRRYLPIINHYYEEYDDRMDRFIINASSAQPQQKVAYFMTGFMEGKRKIEIWQASHNNPKADKKIKRKITAKPYVEEQTISNYVRLNKIFTTRKLINQYCFVAAKKLWEEKENPTLYPKLSYLVELLDSVNGKDISGLLKTRTTFSDKLSNVPEDEKMFNCYAYLMSAELYLKRKDYRAMTASLTPIGEMPPKEYSLIDKDTQCLLYFFLNDIFCSFDFRSITTNHVIRLFDTEMNMTNSDRSIVLKYILLNRLVASSQRYSNNLRNGIVAHEGYKQIDDSIIASYLEKEIKRITIEVGPENASSVSDVFKTEQNPSDFIFSLAWDIFNYVAQKRDAKYPRLEVLKQEIINSLELRGEDQ